MYAGWECEGAVFWELRGGNMRKSAQIGIEIAALILLGVSPGYAQADRCLGTLIPDIRELSFNQASTFAFVDLLQNDFSAEQRAQFGVVAPLGDAAVPLNGSKAQSLAQKFADQTGLRWTQDTTIQMMLSTLSHNAVEAYRICTDGQQTSGPRILAFDATPSQVIVTIRWIAPANAPDVQPATLDWSGGQPNTALAHHLRLKSNDPFSIIFNRTPGKDLIVTVDAGGSDRVFVPYVPQVEVSEQTQKQSTRQYKLETDELGHNEGPKTDCVPAPMDGVIDPSSADVVIDTLKGGKTDSTTYARITKTTTSEICSTGFLRPTVAHQGGTLVWHVTYRTITYSFHVKPPS
jgi:hypothetical protein